MKWVSFVVLALVPLAGCMQSPVTSEQGEPEWIPITITVVRGDDDPAFGAEAVPSGSLALQGFVGFIYSYPTPEDYDRNGRKATPTDPGCRGTNFQPVCSENVTRESYRVPRDIGGSENIMEIAGRYQPLGADGKVVLRFPDAAQVFLKLAGPASLDYPEIQDKANGGKGCSQYAAEDLTVMSGLAEDTTTESSAPRLHFWGPAEIELRWQAFPSGCK